MLFMVIEHFKPGSVRDIYRHLEERGRGIPEGLVYVDSWIEANLARCFQLMETDDALLLQKWVLHWDPIAAGALEIVPVVQSHDTSALVLDTIARESGASS